MRLDHVVMPVADARRSLAFYGETLGLPLAAAFDGPDWGGHPWLMMIFALKHDGFCRNDKTLNRALNSWNRACFVCLD